MTNYMLNLQADIDFKKLQKEKFVSNQADYKKHINNLFSAFEFELVMYDE